jgi:hypothetical protein
MLMMVPVYLIQNGKKKKIFSDLEQKLTTQLPSRGRWVATKIPSGYFTSKNVGGIGVRTVG